MDEFGIYSKSIFRRGAVFEKATFEGEAVFGGAGFEGAARFRQARFEGDADFQWMLFLGGAEFGEATFAHEARFGGISRGASFEHATFQGDAWFGGIFKGNAEFGQATFAGKAEFGEATFARKAEFVGVTFEGEAMFGGAAFQKAARFRKARFQGDAEFGEATFEGEADFSGAVFEQARRIGPLLAHRGLALDGVQFMQPVQIEASTCGMYCRGARFAGGAQFRLRWARVLLDDIELAAPSLLTGIPDLTSDKLIASEQRIAKAWQRLLAGEISWRPQLLSLQRANVAGLGLSNVELTDCRFFGAHNLDKLRLEADIRFATAPARRLDWERRQVIAEERTWRACRTGRWTTPWWPAWLEGERPAILEAQQIAGLYRALRKGREDAKDEPGAADFYYGEMEMRRRARPVGGSRAYMRRASLGRVERGVLTAYWLVSGYGLRAWRALAWLAALTAGFAVAFHLVGFARPPQPVSYWTSLLYAFRATLSLTDSEVELTAWGKLLQALLRLTGPVLLALALLAIRARTKR